MISRTAVLAAVLLRGCTPALEPDDAADDAGVEVASAEEGVTTTPAVAEPPPPPGPPVVAADALLPFPDDDPRAASAASYREAMTALDAGELAAAAARLEEAARGGFAPALVAWRYGDVLTRLGRDAEADVAYASVPPDSRLWPEAVLARAKLAHAGDRPNGVLRMLDELPDDGVPLHVSIRADVLRAKAYRARAADGDLPLAYRACVRVWRSDASDGVNAAEARACMDALEAQVPAELHPNLEDRTARGRALGQAGARDDVIALLTPDADDLDCAGNYELGRALHKKKRYSDAVAPLEAAAEGCATSAEAEAELRVRAHYLWAQALDRSGDDVASIAAWSSLADRYPEHSYADDGLVQAGRLYRGLGNEDDAKRMFQAASDRFPEGDMVGAGMWDAAWPAIVSGETDEALPWLELQAAGNRRGGNRNGVLQGAYWLAKTQLEAATDDATTEQALASLEELARNEPMHWYGVVALWKLASADPERARGVARDLRGTLDDVSEAVAEPDGFEVEQAFLDAPGTSDAIELIRGGLGEDAVTELRRALGSDPLETWERDTLLFASHLYELAGNPHRSHNLLRLAFREDWPELEAEHRSLMLHAYPLAFHEPIVEVTSDYRWPALTFQGLVREESAFSPSIRSWAGAHGLSQLMWPTARATARKMGLRLSRRSQLSDPRTNLDIGATYFEGLYQRWEGHLPLAIASYNAGPGAVKKWMDARGGYELDAFVETIPYRETRNYVKRVTSSWQIYHALYGDGFPYVPLRTGTVRDAVAAGADPSLSIDSTD